MNRLILALALMFAAAPAFAQAEADWTVQDLREQARQRREETRQRLRDAREDARDRARELREEWREARREQWERWRREGYDGVHFRMLRNYYLAADATAHEPIVVVGGDATIDGRTDSDVVVIGGTLRLGPNAVVGGDVVTIGGEAVINPSASVRGDIDAAVVDLPRIDWGVGWPVWNVTGNWGAWWPFVVLGTVLRLSLVLMVSLLLTIVAPGWVRSMGVRASSVVSSGLVGAAAEILFVPALIAVVIGLAVSIVGIPLLGAIPFALAIGALAWTGGFAAVAASLGARLRGSSITTSSSLVTDLLIGFVAICGLTIVAQVMIGWTTPFGWTTRAAGMAVEYVAWTIGLGAALSGWFVSPRPTPPPLPARSVSF